MALEKTTCMHKGVQYECYYGYNLSCQGVTFIRDLSSYMPNLGVDGQAGKEPLNQLPLEMWQMQCRFRGLDESGTVKDLQERLRRGPDAMTLELVNVEAQLRERYKLLKTRREQDAADKNSAFGGAITTPEPKPALARFSAISYDGEEVSVDQMDDDTWLLQTTPGLGLAHYAMRNPMGLSFNSQESGWMTTSTNKQATDQQRIRWCQNRAQEAGANHQPQTVQATPIPVAQSRNKQDPVPQNGPRPEQTALKSVDPRPRKPKVSTPVKSNYFDKNWDVTGTYEVLYDYSDALDDGSERGRYEQDERMYLMIYRAPGMALRTEQLYAEFSFDSLEGWIRFENPIKADPTTPKTGEKRKQAHKDNPDRKRGAVYAYDDVNGYHYEYIELTDLDSGEEEVDNTNGSNTHPPNYQIPKSEHPSPSNPTLPFRWRGRETAERTILLHPDKEVHQLTFSGPGGAKIHGTLLHGSFGSFKFKGSKTAEADGYRPLKTIRQQWCELSESAYERERVGRWAHQVGS